MYPLKIKTPETWSYSIIFPWLAAYPLIMLLVQLLKMTIDDHIYSWFTSQKWWFSMAVFVHRRVVIFHSSIRSPEGSLAFCTSVTALLPDAHCSAMKSATTQASKNPASERTWRLRISFRGPQLRVSPSTTNINRNSVEKPSTIW